MFKKLGTHTFQTEGESDIVVRFGKEVDGVFLGYTTYSVSSERALELLSYVPEEYRGGFEASLIEINVPDLPPHIDNAIKSAINFYVDTGDGWTIFYNKPDHDVFVEKLQNQTDGCVYREEDLIKAGGFCASRGDIYALDIKQIHGVIGCKGLRRAYCLKSYVYSFEDLMSWTTR